MSNVKFLPIDKFNLDDELERQADRYQQANKEWSGLLRKQKSLEARIRRERGKLALDVRANPGDYDVGKLNNDIVDNIVDSDPDIQDMEDELLDLEDQVNTAEGVKWSFTQKRDMLQEMVKLYLNGYWAEPYVSDNDSLSNNQRMIDRANKEKK